MLRQYLFKQAQQKLRASLFAAIFLGLTSCSLPVVKPTGSVVVEELPLKGYPLKASLAYFSPSGDHLLVTLCETVEGFCRPWRYKIAERIWEKISIKGFMPRWSFGSATYSPDGRTIALEFSLCDRNPDGGATCLLKDVKVALLDVETGTLTVLPSEQTRFMPSFMPNGKEIVFWGLTSASLYSSGRAARSSFDFYQMNLADQTVKSVIGARASYPFIPAIVMKDQERVALSAFEITAPVYFGQEVYRYGMIVGANNIDDSVILGNLKTGKMTTLLEQGKNSKKILDISSDNLKALVVINNANLYEMTLNDPQQLRLFPTPTEGNNIRISHATYSPRGDQIAFVRKVYLLLGQTSDLKNAEQIRTPMF
jgi:Tol biopolymer transport system component